jgi:hypothetical protein
MLMSEIRCPGCGTRSLKVHAVLYPVQVGLYHLTLFRAGAATRRAASPRHGDRIR